MSAIYRPGAITSLRHTCLSSIRSRATRNLSNNSEKLTKDERVNKTKNAEVPQNDIVFPQDHEPSPSDKRATKSKKHQGSSKYYSLKNHREGPNTESGELDVKQNKEEVRLHNKDFEQRFEKDKG